MIPEVRRRGLEEAVARLLGAMSLPDAEALHQRLSSWEGRLDLESFVAALTIGETHFFRNRGQFEALERHVLPEVIARRRHRRRLRLWSAGCASGEEAYSLAILVDRLLPDRARWDVLVLGTDINRGALTRAAAATYGPWSFREVPPEIEETYFLRRGPRREVRPDVRAMVTFRYLNLVEDAYPSLPTTTHEIDVVLCRNVLMYFGEEASRRVLSRLHDALADGGWLLVGHVETPRVPTELFGPCQLPGTVSYRKLPVEAARPAPAPPVPPGRGEPNRLTSEDRFLHEQPGAGVQRCYPPNPPSTPVNAPPPRGGGRRGLQEGEPAAGETRGLEAAAERDPGDAWAAYLAARRHADLLRPAEAERWIAVALKRDPLLAPAHLLRALILEEQGRPGAALDALRRCLYADPRWPLPHFVLAALLGRLGMLRRAVKALDAVSALLEGRARDDPIPEGEGLTAGRLGEMAAVQREILAAAGRSGGGR